jgi:hypothetical protein
MIQLNTKTNPTHGIPRLLLQKIRLIGAFIALFAVGASAQQSPGGISKPPAMVNGIAYKLYSSYDANLADDIQGTLKSTGYVNSLTDPDDLVGYEIFDNFSMRFNTNLSITAAGTYQFQLLNTDDQGYLILDGTPIITNAGVGTFASLPILLTAGMHTLELRYSESTGLNTIRLQWKGTLPGLDAPTAYADIADTKYFITPTLTAWYKADAGITGTNAANATAWADQSSNANNLAMRAANNPTYFNSTPTELVNFNPSITFTDDQMQGAED